MSPGAVAPPAARAPAGELSSENHLYGSSSVEPYLSARFPSRHARTVSTVMTRGAVTATVCMTALRDISRLDVTSSNRNSIEADEQEHAISQESSTNQV